MVASRGVAQQQKPLVERLGFAPDAKLLILNADDFGMNSAGTQATIDAMKAGGLTSATIMVPCGWFLKAVEFAKANPQASLGVHTTLTSEWGKYKWGPVLGRTAVPSLVDELGHFHPGVREVYAQANLEEVEKEVKAQIDRAIRAGVDITHIDSHMGTLQYDPKYHELYLKIAKDVNLPCRVAGRELMRRFSGEALIAMADEMGVLHPDFLQLEGPDRVENTANHWTQVLKGLKPGEVSEIYIHPGYDTPEMRDTTSSWKQRTADSDFFKSPETKALIKGLGIELISYRELRELQRTGKPMARVEYNGW
jgi:predicted glycoside hydrolase/deacetylase ChbG (UPF0249 family)